MDFEYKEEYQYFTNACLNVTDACNLACTYCFVQQQPHFMTLDTAKKCVDFLAENIKKHPTKEKGNLTFFGGEPTLMWDDIIVPIVSYVQQEYKDIITFSMTTNGTLLNKDRIDYLAENNIKILLSCDGNETAQNLNRPCRDGQNSFPLVIQNIPYLLEKFPNTTLRSTISMSSVNEVFNTYLFAIENGFKSHFMAIDARSTWSQQALADLKKQMQLVYSHILSQFILGKQPMINCTPIDRAFTYVLLNDVIEIFNNYEPFERDMVRTIEKCGLGVLSAAFGYDGKIYSCQEQPSSGNEYFYIGDIYNGIDIIEHQKLLADYTKKQATYAKTQENCTNCIIQNICHIHSCPSVNYDITGDMLVSSDAECEWKKIVYELALEVMQFLYNNNESFKTYLIKNCNYNQILKEGGANLHELSIVR